MAHDTSAVATSSRAADIRQNVSIAMVSESDAHLSSFNARPSQQAEASVWFDRSPDVADGMRLAALRCALGRLANIVWAVAKAPLLPIGALMESNAVLGLHPTHELFEPDPYSAEHPQASDQWPFG